MQQSERAFGRSQIFVEFSVLREITARPQTHSRPTFTPLNSSLTFLPEPAAYAQFNLIFHSCVAATVVRYLSS